MTSGRAKAAVVASWVVAIAIAIVLAVERFHVGDVSGTDFNIWFAAAREAAAGHSPYLVRLFVYPPPIALLLAPFVHGDHVHVWRVWTALEIVALVAGAGVFVAEVAPGLRQWHKPVLFAFCCVTVLNFWPVTLGLRLGQTDAFVFVLLLVSGLMANRARPVARSVAVGVSALLKGWPVGIGLVLLQRGLRRRRDSVVAFVLTILVAPLLIVVVAGLSGLSDFFSNNFDARTQPLTSDSVWGVPRLLFSRSGIGRPLFVSPFVRFGVTAILVVWVVGLVVVALRTPGDPSMCLWNVTVCLVMLQPIAHTTYTLYGVPILWLWTARVLTRAPSWRSHEIAAAVTLFAWWAINTRAWPGGDPFAVVSAARYCVVFGANLAACTVSVACARATTRDAQSRVMSAVSSPSRSIVV